MIALPSRATQYHDDTPVDRDAGMEIAQNAIPTPAWTARERAAHNGPPAISTR